MSQETVTQSPLQAEHQAAGADFAGAAMPCHYGDPPAEYRAARESVALADLSDRGWLRVSGGERVEFLQGMLSHDVSLPPGRGTYACFLDAKGHLIADMFVYGRPDFFLLELQPGVAPEVRTRLDFYVIVSDVVIADESGEWAYLALLGPQAAAVLAGVLGQEPPALEPLAHWAADWQGTELLVIGSTDLGTPGYKLRLPVGQAAGLWQRLLAATRAAGGSPIGREALAALRIEAGIPLLGADLDTATIPQEAGLDQTAVSFTKGCYVGQETVARLDARGGNVSRRLRGLVLEGGHLPSPGDPVLAGEKEVGKVTSAAYSPALDRPVALAYVHRDHNETGRALIVKHGVASLAATVADLPFTSGSPRIDK